MHFCHEAAAFAVRKRTKLVERPRGEEHRRARHAVETRAPNMPDSIAIAINSREVALRANTASYTTFWKTALQTIKCREAPFPETSFRKGPFRDHVIYGASLEKNTFQGHALRGAIFRNITFWNIRNTVLCSTTQRCTGSIASRNIRNSAPRSIASHNIRNAAPRSIASRGTSSIAFGGAKKRNDARWTNKRLVALDKRDRIAPVHGLHAQAHRAISARFVVQNHLRAQRLAQRSHVSMARDHHAPAEQTIGCSHNMADQRHVAKLSHEFIASETRSHARCHNDASVLQCAVVGSVWHSGIRLCKFDGWTG